MNRIAQAVVFALMLASGFASQVLAQAQDEFRGFSIAELDQMLAPVALYPDTVLSHVLIAATYPIEVVQAARWTRQNPGLRGEQAVNAVIGQDWDPSVMALVAFPDLLARMDADLDWTQMLGDAFLIQEEEVLDSIQRLRAQAFHAGHLRSTEQVQVIREREVIYIEPPRRQVVFVPVYDTRVVFGSWAWAHHPPVFWHAPPHRRSVVVFWGPAFHVPPAFFFSSFHWSHRHVVVVHHHHHFFHPHHSWPRTVVHHHHHHHFRGRDLVRHDAAQRWQHDPVHRRGVAYHPAVDERHRLLERRAAPQAASRASGQAPVRVADTRNSQREWAATRRAEPILPQSGSEALRSSRAAGGRSGVAPSAQTGRAASASDSASRSPAAVRQRTADAGLPRSPERATARTNERQSSAPATAAGVERQLQNRAGTQRSAQAGTRPTSATAAPPATQRVPIRPAQEARTASRPEREAQRPSRASSAPSAPVPRMSIAPRSQEARPVPRSGAASTPTRPALAPQSPRTQTPAAPAGTRSVPQRSSAPVPAPSSESLPAPSTRPVTQRQSQPAAAPRSESRAQPDRRAARRVD